MSSIKKSRLYLGILAIAMSCNVLYTVLQEQENYFSYLFDLSGHDALCYQQALAKAEIGEWQAAERVLKRIPDLYQKQEYFLFYLEILSKTGSHAEIIAAIDKLEVRSKIRFFTELIPFYIYSATELNEYARIADFIELQRKFYPHTIHEIYKKTLYSQLEAENYQQVIQLTDVFPGNIYVEGEKNFILGIAHHNLGYYSMAKGFFKNVLDSDNQYFQRAACDYLSVIAYYLGDLDEVSYVNNVISDNALFNRIIVMLENEMLDEASSLSLRLDRGDRQKLVDLFISWENRHYKTAQAIIESFDDFNPLDYTLTSLILAETSFHLSKYQEAEQLFKNYLRKPNSDQSYANNAIAFSFNNFYRYNNAAYYWIKNLEEGKSFYDSLAVYNLSLLYTHTENYHTAEAYFRSYLRKYQVETGDRRFISSYLRVLKNQDRPLIFRDFFNEYGRLLSVNDKFDALLYIGDYYWDKNEFEDALVYYQMASEIKPDEDLILRMERIYLILGEYEDSEEFVLSFLDKYPQSSISFSLALDLSRFYLSQKRYTATINFIDSFLEKSGETVSTDSLYFYSAIADKELKNTDRAIEKFVSLHKNTQSEELRNQISQQLENIFINMDRRRAIRVLNEIIVDEVSLSDDYLLILAKVYEKASIFEEVNNIYQLLLDEAGEGEEEKKFRLYYLLAINEMYQKEYQQALEYLQAIDLQDDSGFQEDVIFLSYLAHYSLNNFTTAAKMLLKLYRDFPQSSKRFEVVKNLIELFIENDQPLFSWYFVNDFYPHANPTQRFTLDQYKQQLTQIVGEETLAIQQIYDFELEIVNTLELLEGFQESDREDLGDEEAELETEEEDS
jgi:hypothetical protein